jgi:NAD(P)-dependent dehydrogenase (short-subunit alcohol dehydrogenase family)
MLSRYIAQEFGKEGITAKVVAPGLTETDADVFPLGTLWALLK